MLHERTFHVKEEYLLTTSLSLFVVFLQIMQLCLEAGADISTTQVGKSQINYYY